MGKVYLIGAGPGDPELLTLKAARILSQADVVIYDRLVSAEVLTLANPSAKLIFAGKRQGQQEPIQREIFRLLLDYCGSAGVVVRLKGGDPMIFARGAEEWEFLARHGVEVEIVPGVSSSIAIPSLAGVPLTYRGVASSFAVVAGHRQNMRAPDWAKYGQIDTLVILMGVANRRLIARHLMNSGRRAAEPVAFIERGSTERERIITATLDEVARGAVEVDSPAIFVIGEVVRLRERLAAVREEVAVGR